MNEARIVETEDGECQIQIDVATFITEAKRRQVLLHDILLLVSKLEVEFSKMPSKAVEAMHKKWKSTTEPSGTEEPNQSS